MSRGQQVFGWVLFVLSAIAFIASSIRAQDPFGLIGGVIFLIACFVFLIPLLIGRRGGKR